MIVVFFSLFAKKIYYLICSLIDDGKNPDEFTRDVINSCIAKNQVTKGKTDAFKVVSYMVCLLYSYFTLLYKFEIDPPTCEFDRVYANIF